jgi:hypothetical protein
VNHPTLDPHDMVSGQCFRDSIRKLTAANRTLTGMIKSVLWWLAVSAAINAVVLFRWIAGVL